MPIRISRWVLCTVPSTALVAVTVACSGPQSGATAPATPSALAPPAPSAPPAPAAPPTPIAAKSAPAAPAAPTAPEPPAAPAAPTTPTAPVPETTMPAPTALPASFHDFNATTLEGQSANLSQYKGKVLLVVNTASECGLTPQYTGLEQLHEEFSSRGLVVLGIPSNDFGGQEPGSPAQIREFCSTKYNVTFPLLSKQQTKAGEGQSPIYTWLNDKTGSLPRWNFGKYVIGKDGKTVSYFDSKVTPEDPALRKAIETALGS